MMNKQKLFTAIGIALSFAIAIGGWALTSALIDKKSDALLSASGVTWIKAPDAISSTRPNVIGSNSLNDLPELTEREIVSVLKNWESPGQERPHEPTTEQITMEQAIEIGKDGLSFFSDQGIIPAEQLKYDISKTTAYLCQNLPHDHEQFLDPVYSYWTVSFEGESRSANMTINAVTGQVWKIYIKPHTYGIDFSVDDYKNLLTAFLSDMDIKSYGAFVKTGESAGITAFMYFADGDACVVANVITKPTAEHKAALRAISMYLSTQAP